MRVLDYCAGGGGKTLALAAAGAEVVAHDIDPRRMRDLPARAARAGRAAPGRWTAGGGPPVPGHSTWSLPMRPVPARGAWRRAPEGKWRLTRLRLDELLALQAESSTKSRLSGPVGRLAYATCSLLDAENGARCAVSRRHPGWRCDSCNAGSPRSTAATASLSQQCRTLDAIAPDWSNNLTLRQRADRLRGAGRGRLRGR
jgi:16S rRNA (cytosine967-C5)-methyltransferase